jgi:hypothetical protein
VETKILDHFIAYLRERGATLPANIDQLKVDFALEYFQHGTIVTQVEREIYKVAHQGPNRDEWRD